MNYTSILIFIFPFFLSAQEIPKTYSRGSIDIFLGLDYSGAYTIYEEGSPNVFFRLNQFADYKGGLGRRVGVNFNSHIGKDFVIKYGFNAVKHKLHLPFGTGDDVPFIDMFFIETPFVIRRKMEVRKWSPYLEFGLAPTFYLMTNFSQRDPSLLFEKLEEKINKVNLSIIFAGGFNYTINYEWETFFQPTYRLHLKGIETNQVDGNIHFYSIGLECGLRKLF